MRKQTQRYNTWAILQTIGDELTTFLNIILQEMFCTKKYFVSIPVVWECILWFKHIAVRKRNIQYKHK
jgi:hypothetical protein